MREAARARDCALWQAARFLVDTKGLSGRAVNAVRAFLALIDALSTASAGLELHEQMEHVIEHSGLLDFYRNERGERAQTRVENLAELGSRVTVANGAAELAADAEDSPGNRRGCRE